MKLFGKKNKDKAKKEQIQTESIGEQDKDKANEAAVKTGFDFKGRVGDVDVVEGFYTSEKASNLIGLNQYVFRVSKRANKSEVAKNISALFNVKVDSVRILNMPEKQKSLGRYEGTRPGYKKAIVTLKEGYAIEQAKA